MILKQWILLSILTCLRVNLSGGKTVVFLPFVITSHTRVHGMVAEEMVKMGHTVWLALSTNQERMKDGLYPGVNTFSYGAFTNWTEDDILDTLRKSVIKEMDWDWLMSTQDAMADGQVEAMVDRNMTSYVKNLNPDLIVLDWYPDRNEFVALSYELNVPFAILCSFRDLYTARVPFNPIVDAYNSPFFREQANLLQQVGLIYFLTFPLISDLFSDKNMVNRVAPTKPYTPTIDLMSQAEVYIVECTPVVDYPRPSLPNVKTVGSITTHDAKPLQEPFKSFVERSEQNGKVIAVVSFGSLVLRLQDKAEAKLLVALRMLDVNIVWRTSLPSPDPETILTSSWIPQNDLLGNNNTKVFISHCGAHGQYEALYHAVPMVCMPLFYDQPYNADRALAKNLGLTVDLDVASIEEIHEIVREVMLGDKIRLSVEKLTKINHELCKNPRKEAAFWLDHVMKYGGSYMRYSGQKMSWKFYALANCYMLLIGVVVTLVVCLEVLACYCLCSRWCRQRRHMKAD